MPSQRPSRAFRDFFSPPRPIEGDGDLGDEYEAVEHYLNSEVNNLGGHKELADLAEALASLSGAFGEAADYWKGYTGQ